MSAAAAAASALELPLIGPDIEVVRVMAGVVVGLFTVPAKPFAETTLADVTVPEPDSAWHEPSPRRYVLELQVPLQSA